MASETDKAAPMASAPLKYREDGAVDWGNMWDSFCELPRNGGPPHRGTPLDPQEESDPASPGYRFALEEISRGIAAVSGLRAEAGPPGWIAVACPSAGMAAWLAEAISEENVQARHAGKSLLVPVGASYTLKGEIKNVITAVAKTTHYWGEHVHPDLKRTLEMQERLAALGARLAGWWRGRRGRSTSGRD